MKKSGKAGNNAPDGQPTNPQPPPPPPARMSLAALKKQSKNGPPVIPPQHQQLTPQQKPASNLQSPPTTQQKSQEPKFSINATQLTSARRDEDGNVVTSTPNNKFKQNKFASTPSINTVNASHPSHEPHTPLKQLKPLPFYTYPTNLSVKFEKFLKLDKTTTSGGKIVSYPVIGLNQSDATRLGLIIGDLVVLSLIIPASNQQENEQTLQSSPFSTPHKQPTSTPAPTTPFKHSHPSLLGSPPSFSTPGKSKSTHISDKGDHLHISICRVQTFGAIERGSYRIDTQFKSTLPWFYQYQQFAASRIISPPSSSSVASPKSISNTNVSLSEHEIQSAFNAILNNPTRREELDRSFLFEHVAYLTVLRNPQLYFSHQQSTSSTTQTSSLPLQYPQIAISPLVSLSISKNDTIISNQDEISYIIKNQKDALSQYQNSPSPSAIPSNSTIPSQLSTTLDTAVISSLISAIPTYLLPNTPLAASLCGAFKPYFPYQFCSLPEHTPSSITSPNQPSPIIIYSTTPHTAVNLTLGRRPISQSIPSITSPSTSSSSSSLFPHKTMITIAGLDQEMSILRETLELPLTRPELFTTFGLKPPKGVLLHGSPGCGKTLLAHWFSQITSAQFIPLTATNIISRGGASYIYKLFSTLSSTPSPSQSPSQSDSSSQKSIPIIIFIDEIDGLCNDNTIICALLSLLDGGHDSYSNICILAATNRPNVLPPALRRPGRFDVELHITPPGIQAREEILKVKLVNQNILHNLTCIELTSIAEHLNGFVGADIDLLISEAISYSILRAYQIQSETEMNPIDLNDTFNPPVILTDFKHALQIIRPSGLRDYNAISITDSQVGGHEEIKQRLEEAFEWPLRHANLVQALGARKSSGILLFGPPGCAKTLLAKSICARSKRTFLCVKGPELFSKYVGDSEKAVRNVFQRARACAPCILFLDEIDSFGASRGGSGGDATDRVVSQLLVELDGIGDRGDVCILAASNRPDLVDRALLRAGRLDRSLYVGPPDETETSQILQINLGKVVCQPEVFSNLPQFSLLCFTKRHTGAELAAICRDASVRALSRYILQQQHLMTEMKDNFANLSSDEFVSLFALPSPTLELAAPTSPISQSQMPTNSQDVCVTYQDVLDAITNAVPRITPSMIEFYTEYQKKHGLTNL